MPALRSPPVTLRAFFMSAGVFLALFRWLNQCWFGDIMRWMPVSDDDPSFCLVNFEFPNCLFVKLLYYCCNPVGNTMGVSPGPIVSVSRT